MPKKRFYVYRPFIVGAFNESQYLSKTIENYKNRFGFYPSEVLADRICCTRDNRKLLKEKGIKLIAKPLERPSSNAVAVT